MRKADAKIHAGNNRTQPGGLYWLSEMFGKAISVFQTIKKLSNVPYAYNRMHVFQTIKKLSNVPYAYNRMQLLRLYWFGLFLIFAVGIGFAAEKTNFKAADGQKENFSSIENQFKNKDFKKRRKAEKLSAEKIKIQKIKKLSKDVSKKAESALLTEFKNEKDDNVRAHIAHALALKKSSETVRALISAAKNDKSARTRSLSILSLGVIGDKTCVKTLIEILLNENENENIRVGAASSLTFYIHEKGVKAALAKALKTKDRVIRLGIVNSLRNIKTRKEGIELLTISRQDKDKEIKKLAESLLK